MAAPPPAVASERELLLATKLNVPRPQLELVPRLKLTERLDEGLTRGLVLVCAPAGYGKTVLLAEWTRRAHRRTGWLSVDAADNDPARFWRHAVAALDRARPGLGARVSPLLGPPALPSLEPLVTALINELAAESGDAEVVLVLDDYHLIDSQPVHDSLGFLLDQLSGELCDVVTGRPGSQALLEQVEQAGLFLVPLDEVRGWWRYHHLFADLLRAPLQAERPEQVAQLHRNAAAWHAGHGRPDDAIRYAVAAGEMSWAAVSSPAAARASARSMPASTSGCSPTKGRRWPRCWAGSSRPSGPNAPMPAASRLIAWPGSSMPSTAPGQTRGQGPLRRCRASWSR
jgi:LuxR family maltose regulon positive regulatory protein